MMCSALNKNLTVAREGGSAAMVRVSSVGVDIRLITVSIDW
jgi:hypothetical protein